MGVTGVHLCEFYVCKTVDSHVELIGFDELFWETNTKKANTFYCNIIITCWFLCDLGIRY